MTEYRIDTLIQEDRSTYCKSNQIAVTCNLSVGTVQTVTHDKLKD